MGAVRVLRTRLGLIDIMSLNECGVEKMVARFSDRVDAR